MARPTKNATLARFILTRSVSGGEYAKPRLNALPRSRFGLPCYIFFPNGPYFPSFPQLGPAASPLLLTREPGSATPHPELEASVSGGSGWLSGKKGRTGRGGTRRPLSARSGICTCAPARARTTALRFNRPAVTLGVHLKGTREFGMEHERLALRSPRQS